MIDISATMTEQRFEDVFMIAYKAGYKLHAGVFDGRLGYMLVEHENNHQIDFVFSTLTEVLEFLSLKSSIRDTP